MKSTSGQYYVALDHIRALAALMVVSWHFLHGMTGTPVRYSFIPTAPIFSLFDEGHTGVALFMTLSGYLFAKLLDGKRIHFSLFLYNRILRLAPLLIFTWLALLALAYWNQVDPGPILHAISTGWISPSWPNGGWSITTELHFYILLPILLLGMRYSPWVPLQLILAFIFLRLGLWIIQGEVQTYSYWTIIGRFDQFALGMLAYHARSWIAGKNLLAIFSLSLFCLFYYYFDGIGGFFNAPSYPSPNLLWVVMPTIEGFFYGLGIAWYAESFKFKNQGWVSKILASFGELSYSIYLLHFFFVFKASEFVNTKIMPISNFYLALLWTVMFFIAMWPIAYLSHRFIEMPFLRYRKNYLK